VGLAEGCRQLETFVIKGQVVSLRFEDASDAQFYRIFTCLPNLRKLDLNLVLDISAHSLISLGTHCPYLEWYRLGGKFDLSILGMGNQVLFPQLRRLELADLACERISSAKAVASIVLYHVPHLENYQCYACSDASCEFEVAMKRALNDVREEPQHIMLQRVLRKVRK